MTLIEAAARLGTSAANLRGAIARGSLKAVKHGRDWWVTEAEVERYRRESRRSDEVRRQPRPSRHLSAMSGSRRC